MSRTHAPRTVAPTPRDYMSDQQIRWCPGCGDYAVLAGVQEVLCELGLPPERVVFVTGIGCAGRFSYYMNTYGVHGIHGRAPALATGLAAVRDDLSIWVVSGDGDALSIGANHLVHALRRNVPVRILLLNNQVYGLTKGQASPTSATGMVTRSTPHGHEDRPLDPIRLALGADATFVARTIDREREHLLDVLRAAAAHPGTAFVEILQDCPVFNEGAFAALTGRCALDASVLILAQGEPVRFGPGNRYRVVRGADGSLEVADGAVAGDQEVIVHDAHRSDPAQAFALAGLGNLSGPTPIGVFRSVRQPVWGAETITEYAAARERVGEAELSRLLEGRGSWTVQET